MSEPTKYVVPTDMLTGEWPGMRVYGDTTRVVTVADALAWKDAECAKAVAEEYVRWRTSAEDVLATLDSLEAEYQRGRAEERAEGDRRVAKLEAALARCGASRERALAENSELWKRLDATHDTRTLTADGPEPVSLDDMGTDGQKWAQAFVDRFGGDEGLMIGWFANAIEAGRTAGMASGYPIEQPNLIHDGEATT